MTDELYVEAVGADRIAHKLAGMAERALEPELAFQRITHELEVFESVRFGWFGGEYVDTGETRASLTGAGSGAIRETSAEGVEFGTSVDQARFHPQVLVPMTAGVSRDVGRTLLEFVVGGPVSST